MMMALVQDFLLVIDFSDIHDEMINEYDAITASFAISSFSTNGTVVYL